jgi:hypothetical protein
VRKSFKSPPPFPSPLKGDGNSFPISLSFPSPLAGEGRVRGLLYFFPDHSFWDGGKKDFYK